MGQTQELDVLLLEQTVGLEEVEIEVTRNIRGKYKNHHKSEKGIEAGTGKKFFYKGKHSLTYT